MQLVPWAAHRSEWPPTGKCVHLRQCPTSPRAATQAIPVVWQCAGDGCRPSRAVIRAARQAKRHRKVTNGRRGRNANGDRSKPAEGSVHQTQIRADTEKQRLRTGGRFCLLSVIAAIGGAGVQFQRDHRRGPARDSPRGTVETRRIGFLGYDLVQALDLIGPSDAFASDAFASEISERPAEIGSLAAVRPPYEVVIIGLTGKRFVTSSGITMHADVVVPAPIKLDTLIIPGGAGLRRPGMPERAAAWFRTISLWNGT